MDVAVSKLTSLFSHQLEWSTIEAVLWMPASLSREPRIAALKQLAVSGVKQKLGVLDTALAQPSTRLMLQSLPPDVLTAILSSDTLLTTSENTVIAAIDLWMAGPVAQTLAHLSDHHAASAADSCNLSSSSSQCCLGAADVTDGSNAGSSGGSSHSSSRSSLQQQSLEHSSREDSSSAERGVNSGQEQLLAAQMLLLGAVRLNQCSGGFLAAAVERMPWLCRALQDRAADLQLLEQYCRSDSEGRYQLSMHLIQQTISCPWQPKLRKALPAGYTSSSSSSTIDKLGATCTLLSELRGLLDITIRQQTAQKARLFQAVCSPAAPPPGIFLSEFVNGGYVWRLSLVAAPFRRPRSQARRACSGVGEAVPADTAATAAAETAAKGISAEAGSSQEKPHRQQLAVSIICRPAWTSNLVHLGCGPGGSGRSTSSCSAGPQGSRAGVAAEGADSRAGNAGPQPGQAGGGGGGGGGGAVVLGDPTATAAAASLLAISAAAVYDRESHSGSGRCDAHVCTPAAASGGLSTCCSVCKAICGIAASKAAAAAARHLGRNGSSAGGCGSSGSNGGSSVGSSWCHTQDVLVGVSVVAAPTAALLQGLVGASAAKGPAACCVPVRLSWSDAAGAAFGLVPLDVAGIGIGSSNLVCGWGCSPQELPAGAVEVSQAAAVADARVGAVEIQPGAQGPGAGAGAVGVVGEAGAGPAGAGSLIVGWQPEMWSRVAYTGELHWHSTLRLLSD